MPSIPFLYTDFHGGLNTLDSAYLLTDNESRDLVNVQGTTAGAIVKRAGLVTLSSPADTLTSLFPLESVSPTVLVGAGGTSLYKVSTGGTATSIKSGLTNNLRWEFVSGPVVSGQGPLFGMNGTDTPQQWDGAAGATVAWTNASGGVAVPNGTYCVYHQNQMFVAGVAATPSRLYWSAIADPTNWDPASLTGAGFMDFDPKDGEAITAIGTVGPYLLVGKPRKLWILVDPASATVRQLSSNVGVASHRSVASGAEGTYFLAEDRGVFVTNGSKLTPISDKIQPTLNGATALQRQQAAGAYFDAHYYLSLPLSSSTNDTTLDYDAKLGSWWKHSFGENQFAIWHPAGAAQLYGAKGTSAVVDQCFAPGVYVDNGTAFTWVWRGPWQSPTFYRRRRFPTPYFRKRLRQVRFDGSGTVNFSLAKNFVATETLIQTDVFNYAATGGTFGGGTDAFAGSTKLFGGVPTITPAVRAYSLGVANAFSMVFSSTSTSPDTVTSYVMMITDRKDLVVS